MKQNYPSTRRKASLLLLPVMLLVLFEMWLYSKSDSNLTSSFKCPERDNLFKFTTCPSLTGSSFNAVTLLVKENVNVSSSTLSAEEIVGVIESTALEIENAVLLNPAAKDADAVEVRRFSCLSAAMGINSFKNISSSRFLKHVDSENYFRQQIPTIKKDVEIRVTTKYKIAYFVMVKNAQELQAIKPLIDILDDGLAVFLVHVDQKTSTLNVQSLNWIATKQNVHRTKSSFSGEWGHSSLVFLEMNGFFELLDLAEWDFLINLSGTDFPLRKNQDIYDYLQAGERANHTWVDYSCDNLGPIDRSSALTFKKQKPWGTIGTGVLQINDYFRPWAYESWKKYCKGSQWMILDRKFIENIRSEQATYDLLAFLEHTWTPDESFFPILIENNPEKLAKNFKKNMRYVQWFVPAGSSAPKYLTLEDTKDFNDFTVDNTVQAYRNPKYLFVRKVSQDQKDLVGWIRKYHLNLNSIQEAQCPFHLTGSPKNILSNPEDSGKISNAGDCNTLIPKIIWTYWGDQWEMDVSLIAEDFVEAWKAYNPDHKINILTPYNFEEYIKLNKIPSSIRSSRRHVGEWVQLAVLKEHGGIWIDISVLLTESVSFIHDIKQAEKSEGFVYYLDSFTTNKKLPFYELFLIATIKDGQLITLLFEEYNSMHVNGLTEKSYLAKLNQTHPASYGELTSKIGEPEWYIIQVMTRKILLVEKTVSGFTALAAESGPQLLRHCLGWWESNLIFKALLDDWEGPVPQAIKLNIYEQNDLALILHDSTISPKSIFSIHVRPRLVSITPIKARGTYLQASTLPYYSKCNEKTKHVLSRYYQRKDGADNRIYCSQEFLENLVDVDTYPPIRASPISESSVNVEWILFTTSCEMGTNRLVKSITEKGIPLTILGYDRPFIGFGQRIRMIYDYLSTIPADRIVIITDTKDVILVPGCTIEEILQSYASFNTPILFSSEVACYPHSRLKSLYQDPLETTGRFSPFKYLNAGTSMGKAGGIEKISNTTQEFFIAVMALMKHVYENDCIDDQGEFSIAHVNNISYTSQNPWTLRESGTRDSMLTVLDWYNAVFMAMYSIKANEFDYSQVEEKKRIFYPKTNASVCILHQSGPKIENRALEEISKKLGMDYDRVIDGENYNPDLQDYSNI